MVTDDDVREGLADACRAYRSDMSVYEDLPMGPSLPAVVIRSPESRGAIKYGNTLGRGYAVWRFTVMIIIGQVNDRAARKLAGELISPKSPLINALNAAKFNGRGHAIVQEAIKGTTTVGKTRCTCAELSVLVRA